MKRHVLPLVLSVATLAGCAAPSPSLVNPDGQPMKFANPILSSKLQGNARFVLIEKDIGTGSYKLIAMSKTRPAITNPRQERIAFSSDLTSFAPDYTDTNFYTYTDTGNYDEKTVVVDCPAITPQKTEKYSPCNSDFSYLFVPMGVTKAYVAGRMSKAAKDSWEDPNQNRRRGVRSPSGALRQSGVFSQLNELKSINN